MTDLARDTTLAVDLGGTHMRCAVVGPGGTVLDRHEAPTPRDGQGPEALTELMASVHAMAPCAGAVVGVPGRVDYFGGTLEYAPNLPPSWATGITEQRLTEALGITVALANDADLAAVGETWFGAGRGCDDVVYVTFSTGVGAGAVLARRLVHGRRSLVEIGHTIIDVTASDQTLEGLASGTALVRQAAAAGIAGTGPDIIAAVRAGQPAATVVWGHVAAAAAAGVVNLAWLFTPQVIVVGGGLGLVGNLLLETMRAALAAHGPPALDPAIAVVGAALGDDAGLAGAAAWADAFVPESAGRSASARATETSDS
jgi:glucokinase